MKPRTFDEAMHKIRQLEAALAKIASYGDGMAGYDQQTAARIAREALGMRPFVMPTKETTGETI